MKSAQDRTLVVILPAHNEEKTVGDLIRNIPERIEGIQRIRALVIDDGSTDATAELARQAGAGVLHHESCKGVGAAFATGIEGALRMGADFIVNMDADGQFDPAHIPALLAPLIEGTSDFVTCTRFGDKRYEPEMPRAKKWGNRMMCRIINTLIPNGRFTDVSCGFRAYTRGTALRLNLFGRYTYTQESFIDLAYKDVRMAEVPLPVRGERKYGDSRIASNLWRYGMNTLAIILRSIRDVQPLRFFGLISVLFLIFGLLQGGFVFAWWVLHHQTSPFRNLVVSSGTFLTLGILFGMLALLADMIGSLRKTTERMLLLQKERTYMPRELPRDPFLPEEDEETRRAAAGPDRNGCRSLTGGDTHA